VGVESLTVLGKLTRNGASETLQLFGNTGYLVFDSVQFCQDVFIWLLFLLYDGVGGLEKLFGQRLRLVSVHSCLMAL
jgi:hypothetical protein